MDPTARDPECKCRPDHDYNDSTCGAHKRTGLELPQSEGIRQLEQIEKDLNKLRDDRPVKERTMDYTADRPIEVKIPLEEKTLDEVVEGLPETHRARIELNELRNEVDMVGAINHRAERIAVASRVLAGLVTDVVHQPELPDQLPVLMAIKYADALIARIDETGKP